jgi:hypothetical protein
MTEYIISQEKEADNHREDFQKISNERNYLDAPSVRLTAGDIAKYLKPQTR